METNTAQLREIADGDSGLATLDDRVMVRTAADEIDELRKRLAEVSGDLPRFARNWPAEIVLDVTPDAQVVFARKRREGE